EADDEGQQPEGGEVEVKAVGQPFEFGLGVGLDQTKLMIHDGLERLIGALGRAEQKPRYLARLAQKALSNADVDDEHAGDELRRDVQRRQFYAIACQGLRALRSLQIGQRLRRQKRLS